MRSIDVGFDNAASMFILKLQFFVFNKKRYRQAIDAAWDNVVKERNIKERMAPRRIISAPDEHVSRLDLTHVFARGQDENNDGLTPGFFEGPKHQR